MNYYLDGNVLASQNYVKNEVEHLKGVIKCSLIHKSAFNQSSGKKNSIDSIN